jgi:beta-lactamase superfamily II metal-dependent hydrolase
VQNDPFDWDGVKGPGAMACGHQPGVTTASNHDSLVMAMDDGGINFLLPADIEKKVENELVASTDAFVAAVAPKFAVVSVGDGNPFGHPVEWSNATPPRGFDY